MLNIIEITRDFPPTRERTVLIEMLRVVSTLQQSGSLAKNATIVAALFLLSFPLRIVCGYAVRLFWMMHWVWGLSSRMAVYLLRGRTLLSSFCPP
jgi:hypothetical protein